MEESVPDVDHDQLLTAIFNEISLGSPDSHESSWCACRCALLEPSEHLLWLFRQFIPPSFTVVTAFKESGGWSPATMMTMLALLKAPGHTYCYRSIVALANRLNSNLLSWKVTPTIGSMSKTRNKLSSALCHEFLQQLAKQVTC